MGLQGPILDESSGIPGFLRKSGGGLLAALLKMQQEPEQEGDTPQQTDARRVRNAGWTGDGQAAPEEIPPQFSPIRQPGGNGPRLVNRISDDPETRHNAQSSAAVAQSAPEVLPGGVRMPSRIPQVQPQAAAGVPPGTFGSPGLPSVSQPPPAAPGQNGRQSLVDEMRARYEQLNTPPPAPTGKQRLLQMVLKAAPLIAGGIAGKSYGLTGAAEGENIAADKQLANRRFTQNQNREEGGRLLQEMAQYDRMQHEDDAALEREKFQESAQTEREKAAAEAQGRGFAQQKSIEDQREAAHREDQQASQAASEARQSRQFQEQEKLQDKRFSQENALADKRQAGSSADQRSYQFQTSRIDKIAKPIEDRAERLTRLVDTMAQGNPQSDALVAPELLTSIAGGAGSGLRMNEAEISRIVGGRTNWETIKAKLDAWKLDPTKGFALTTEQRKQVNSLVGTIRQRVLQKQEIIDEERENLSNSHDSSEHRQIVDRLNKRLNAVDAQGGQKAAKLVNGVWVDATTGQPIQSKPK